MAFAESTDVEAALGRDLTTPEEESVDTLLDEATDLLIGYLGCAPDPVPDAVRRVCARMVARVFQQAAAGAPVVGASQMQQTAGPFSQSTSFSSGSTSGAPWLAAADKVTLKPYRCGAFRSVPVESVQSGKYRHGG